MRIENLSVRFEDKVIFDHAGFWIGEQSGDKQVPVTEGLRRSSNPANHITCITGPSGVGKTTLLRVIAGLHIPESGTIIGNGRKPAFMFQEDRLLPWLTAKDNIMAVMSEDSANPRKNNLFVSERKVIESSKHSSDVQLSKKELSDLAEEWLDKVELLKEKDSYPAELSGGMQRRVSLARTLAYGGDIILMDEPLKGLDQALVERMVPVILAEKAPILISTHSNYEIELFGGNVLEIG